MRTELAPAPALPALPARFRPASDCHEASKYQLDLMDERGPYPVGPADPAPTAPQYHLPPAQLPPVPLYAALAERRSVHQFSPEPLSLAQVSALLGAAIGERPHPDPTQRYAVRSYPSAGARFPIDLLLWARVVDDLPAGFYRYLAQSHGLSATTGDAERLLGALLPPGPPAGLAAAPLWLVLTANLPRSAVKYGLRAYRFALQEVGHLAQNLQLTATALGLGSLVMGAYLDDEVHGALGLDGVTDVALALIPVGQRAGDSQS